MKFSRQLAAIMFTDIQGYTKLMQQDEEKAIEIRNKHRNIFNASTEEHSGKILQYYGDGTLSIFSSAIDAVNCAIEMQKGFSEKPAIPVRIGIHTGDIIINDEEIIGDGVNVASRIESLAEPGSIIISEKVFDEIKNQQQIKTLFLKSVKFKNIEKTIDVYAIAGEGLVVPDPEKIKGKTDPDYYNLHKKKSSKSRTISLAIILPILFALIVFSYFKFTSDSSPFSNDEEKSIAVLAFENMSGNPEDEYFSDGISEEILNSLTRIKDLKVAGRTSSFSFKGKNEDIRTIGNQLDVQMVLEGSVRKVGEKIRITAQLINVKDGFHLWSETYDRDMNNIISVQQDIADRIADKLRLQVQNVSEKPGTQNAEAYGMLLKGSYLIKRDYEDKKRAMEYFQKAVKLDPEYAEAYAYIGETYIHFAGMNIISTGEAYSKARTSVQKAIMINEHQPRAHKVLAYINLFYDWNWDSAISEYNKAIEYGFPEDNEFITYYEIFVNKNYDKAVEICERVIEKDPLNIDSYWQLGICNYFAERFDDALSAFNKALELDKNYSAALHWKGVVLGYLGRYDEAVSSFEKALQISKGEILANLDFLMLKIQMGEKDEVLPIVETGEYIDPMDPAKLYTQLGMYDKAIFWMEKGFRERSVMMITLKHFWLWDPLRDKPGFIELYNKMNFE